MLSRYPITMKKVIELIHHHHWLAGLVYLMIGYYMFFSIMPITLSFSYVIATVEILLSILAFMVAIYYFMKMIIPLGRRKSIEALAHDR